MKLFVVNENEILDVHLLLDESERQAESGMNSFSLGISRAIEQFLHQFAQTDAQATELDSRLNVLIQNMVGQYIDRAFNAVVKLRQEKTIFPYMVQMFAEFLQNKDKKADELIEKFQHADTLKFDIALEENMVTIYLTNGDSSVCEPLESFSKTLIEDADLFERTVNTVYLVALVLAALVFGDANNPIRALDDTPGYADGGLMQTIKNIVGL